MGLNLYTISWTQAFLPTLAAGIKARVGDDPVTLAQVKVFLPNFRTVRGLQQALLAQSAGALLLPQATAWLPEAEAGFNDVGGVMTADKRLLVVSRLVRQSAPSRALSDAMTLALAKDFLRLYDDWVVEAGTTPDFAALVPDAFASHWQQQAVWLQQVWQAWQAYLATSPEQDPTTAALQRLRSLTTTLPHDNAPLLIAAGPTRLYPALLDFLAAVAQHPRGAVVLQGGAVSTEPLSHSHPLAEQQRLWQAWSVTTTPPLWHSGAPVNGATEAAIEQLWRNEKATLATRPNGWRLITTPYPEAEAKLVALLVRHALANPAQRVAVVTNDRALAERISAHLKRYAIQADDSAGQRLTAIPALQTLGLLLTYLTQPSAPVLQALLAQPLFGLVDSARDTVTSALVDIFFPPTPTQVLAKLPSDAAALPLLQKLQTLSTVGQELRSPADWLALLLPALEDLVGAERLWQDEAGQQALEYCQGLAAALAEWPAQSLADCRALLLVLLQQQTWRSPYGSHDRVQVWGMIESRLQSADLVIIAGANNNFLPAPLPHNVWLNQAMEQALGLIPARRLGRSAHDVAALLGYPQVVLTRSERYDGQITTPSPYWERLVLLGEAVGQPFTPTTDHALSWLVALDQPAPPAAPAPVVVQPRAADYPARLSISALADLWQKPYHFFVAQVLRIPNDDDKALAVTPELTAQYLGTLVHQTLQAAGAETLSGEALMALFAKLAPQLPPPLWHKYVPELEQMWDNYQQWNDREAVVVSAVEQTAQVALSQGQRVFTLVARADRLDKLTDGTLRIIDYKTGSFAATKKDILSGEKPQLLLQAWLAQQGSFGGAWQLPVSSIAYWPLAKREKKDPDSVRPSAADIAAIAERLTQSLQALAAGEMQFIAPDDNDVLDEMAHLARTGAWL